MPKRIRKLKSRDCLHCPCFTVIISATVAQFVDRIGRRPLWLISTGGMLCSYVIITALSATFAKTQNNGTGLAVIPFLFIFFGF